MKTIDEINDFINNNSIALLYFSTDKCGACYALKQKILNLINEYKKVVLFEVAEEDSLEIAPIFNVYSFPVLIVYIEGKEVIRKSKYMGISELQETIDRYYNMIF